jgi:acetyltransferase-like isoleucine patch superfamily enzyme
LAKKFPRKCHKLTIENGVWIGFRATILAGVTVGHQSVIGAHALVRKNVEPKVVYAGIPAKKIKNLEELDKN